jgi:hypothetical protein
MVYEKLDTSYLALKQHIITDKKLNDAIEQWIKLLLTETQQEISLAPV